MNTQNLAVIFDVDGVLVDSFEAHYESWHAMADERGVHFTREQFAATFGRTSREIIEELWPHPLTPEQVRECDDYKESLYRKIIREHFPEMAGARNLIAQLHENGFNLAVGSSGPVANIDAALEGLGHREVFGAVVSGQDVTRGKPAPEVFLLAAKRLGIEPRLCVVIEDAPAGIQAAKAAGMKCIAITGTAPREKLLNADRIVERLAEITPSEVAELILL